MNRATQLAVVVALGTAIGVTVDHSRHSAPIYITCVLPQPRSATLHFVWKTTKAEIRDGVLVTPDGAYRLMAGEMCLFDTEPPALGPTPKERPASQPAV